MIGKAKTAKLTHAKSPHRRPPTSAWDPAAWLPRVTVAAATTPRPQALPSCMEIFKRYECDGADALGSSIAATLLVGVQAVDLVVNRAEAGVDPPVHPVKEGVVERDQIGDRLDGRLGVAQLL